MSIPLTYEALKKRVQMPTLQLMEEVGGIKVCTPKTENGVEIERRYAYRKSGNNKILAVAHCDFRDCGCDHCLWDEKNIVFSSRLDDRLGIAILLDCLPKMGLEYDLLLTDHEETSDSTAKDFAADIGKDHDYNWMFQFDRRGDDCVCYSYTEMKPKIEKHFKHAYGSASDISKMSDLEIGGINVGTGYHEEHKAYSYALVSEIVSQVTKFHAFYKEFADEKVVSKKFEYTGSHNYNNNVDSDTRSFGYYGNRHRDHDPEDIWQVGRGWVKPKVKHFLDASEGKKDFWLFTVCYDLDGAIAKLEEKVREQGRWIVMHTYCDTGQCTLDHALDYFKDKKKMYEKVASIRAKRALVVEEGDDALSAQSVVPFATLDDMALEKEALGHDYVPLSRLEDRRAANQAASWGLPTPISKVAVFARKLNCLVGSTAKFDNIKALEREEVETLAQEQVWEHGYQRKLTYPEFAEHYKAIPRSEIMRMWSMFCNCFRKAAAREKELNEKCKANGISNTERAKAARDLQLVKVAELRADLLERRQEELDIASPRIMGLHSSLEGMASRNGKRVLLLPDNTKPTVTPEMVDRALAEQEQAVVEAKISGDAEDVDELVYQYGYDGLILAYSKAAAEGTKSNLG